MPTRLLIGLIGSLLLTMPALAQPEPPAIPCQFFPADNIWNTTIDHLPLDPQSAAYIETIGADVTLHADFGSGDWPEGSGDLIGIPYNVVTGDQPLVEVVYTDYGDESDPGPFPIPADGVVESASDHHVLVVDSDNCRLYELYNAYPQTDGSWEASNGAAYDLTNHALRPAGWTSADAAGLPILPGLVRYEEVLAGEINHAIRFTIPETQRAYIWPARHWASDIEDAAYPPMGQRFRLRADFDMSDFDPEVQVILRAMQTYGIILADNGSAMFISGVPDPRWDNDMLRQLRSVTAGDFEAVAVCKLMVDPDSGQAEEGAGSEEGCLVRGWE